MTTLTSVAATVEATLVLAAIKRSTIVQINATKQTQKNARVKGVERT
ncbi:MAG: hypothetical protein ACRDQ9_17135 [Pseudonocardiaceae bacterium]